MNSFGRGHYEKQICEIIVNLDQKSRRCYLTIFLFLALVTTLFSEVEPLEQLSTGQPRYVKLAYLEYTAYVKVIIHFRAFPLYCFVFQTCLCRTWLSRNLGYIEVVFHSQNLVFHFFTTTCVEVNFVLVKNLNNMNVKQSN